MNIKNLVILLFAVFVFHLTVSACTVAVVSGKYTKDGRPLLWKNRDTWAIHNKIMYFKGDKYEYMGLVNSGDIKGKSIWIGMNSAGFAIMNSASYNLNIGDTTRLNGLEGQLMKKALETCGSIEDFEKFLEDFPKPTRLEANFGVIDANNGAAMFEVNNKGFVKFDANDPTVAPFGYILRGNYSFTGSFGKESSGYIRYNTVNELFYDAMSTNTFDAQFILQDATRGLKHSLMKTDLYKQYASVPENNPTYAFFHDFIPRTSSASACVVQGVKKGENAELTTLWSVVGFPLTSVVVPTWVKGGKDVPLVVRRDEKLKDSPVCYAALELKKQLFPIRWGKFASKYYININALSNADNSGIRQKIKPHEDAIFAKTYAQMDIWRENGMKKSEVAAFYEQTTKDVQNLFKVEFGIEI